MQSLVHSHLYHMFFTVSTMNNDAQSKVSESMRGSAPLLPSALFSLAESRAAITGRGEHKPPCKPRRAIYPSPHSPEAAVS